MMTTTTTTTMMIVAVKYVKVTPNLSVLWVSFLNLCKKEEAPKPATSGPIANQNPCYPQGQATTLSPVFTPTNESRV
jgi:hypothetical protein